jgi:phosphoglycolate phosphatase
LSGVGAAATSVFDVIVFDYDGTLFDTRAAIAHCLRATFAASGRPLPSAEVAAAAVSSGLTLPDTLVALDRSLGGDQAALMALVKCYRAIYAEEAGPWLRPFAGVGRTLRALHESGIKCLVVSNKGVAAIRRSLDDACMSRFVDLIFGDAPSLPHKPDPTILTDHILPRYAPLPRERILIVGDTETDIVFARAAGICACWAAYGYGVRARCRSLAPEFEIATMAELLALVWPH